MVPPGCFWAWSEQAGAFGWACLIGWGPAYVRASLQAALTGKAWAFILSFTHPFVHLFIQSFI